MVRRPADRKPVRDVVIAEVVVETLERLNPKFPGPPPAWRSIAPRCRRRAPRAAQLRPSGPTMM